MDTKKLAKIIKLIVEQELKRQLPKLVKQGVHKVLKETKRIPVTKRTQVIEEEQDPFSLANAMLDEDRVTSGQVENVVQPIREKKHFTSNSALNEVLNNTVPFNSAQRGTGTPDTISFGTNLAQGGTEALNQVAAGQMGKKPISSFGNENGGMGVQTGLPGLDRILNRDNSELVKRFKTRK